MNARTIQIMGGATIVLALAAVWAAQDRGGASADERTGKRLFPDLVEKVNQVSSVTIESKDEEYTLRKNGEQWTLVEKGGYPVKFDRIREITNAIAFFEIVEPKTSKPELYSRLDVDDPGAEDSNSTRVALKDASGAVLADVIVGKANTSGDRMADASLFVRRTGEAQAFEVLGRVNLGGTATLWLDKDITKIPRERIRRVLTTQPDGTRLELIKNERTDANLTVADMPEGRELKYPAVTDQIGSALAYMSFEDVRPASEVDFDSAIVTEYECWDGLRVVLRTVREGEKYYVRFEPSFDPSLRVEPASVPEPPPAEGEEPPPPTPADDPLKPEDEVRAEAKALGQRLSGWAYELPGYRGANFEKKVEDMLKPLPDVDEPDPPAPPAPAVGEPGGDEGGEGGQ